MQQTKQTRRACAGGAAARHGAAARQVGAAVRPAAGVPRPSDVVSAGTATSTAVLSQDSAGKAAGCGRKAGVPTEGTGSSPTIPGLPPGGFATILVDPPWPLQSGEKHYRTMSLARIKALPVGSLGPVMPTCGCGRRMRSCRRHMRWPRPGALRCAAH